MLHAEQLLTEEDGIAARKRLVKAVYEWQQSSAAPAAPAVNVVCDVVLGSSGGCRGWVTGGCWGWSLDEWVIDGAHLAGARFWRQLLRQGCLCGGGASQKHVFRPATSAAASTFSARHLSLPAVCRLPPCLHCLQCLMRAWQSRRGRAPRGRSSASWQVRTGALLCSACSVVLLLLLSYRCNRLPPMFLPHPPPLPTTTAKLLLPASSCLPVLQPTSTRAAWC